MGKADEETAEIHFSVRAQTPRGVIEAARRRCEELVVNAARMHVYLGATTVDLGDEDPRLLHWEGSVTVWASPNSIR